MPLNQFEIEAIEKHANHLTHNLSSIDLIPLLIDHQIFTCQDIEQIHNDNDDETKMAIVMEILKGKDPGQFYKFCNLLQDSNNETIAIYAGKMLRYAVETNMITDSRSTRVRNRVKSSSGDVKSLSRLISHHYHLNQFIVP